MGVSSRSIKDESLAAFDGVALLDYSAINVSFISEVCVSKYFPVFVEIGDGDCRILTALTSVVGVLPLSRADLRQGVAILRSWSDIRA